MTKLFHSLNLFFNSKIVALFFIHLVIAIILGYFFSWLNNTYFHYKNPTQNGLIGLPEVLKGIIIIVVAPLIETLLFQLPLFFYKSFKKHYWIFFMSCLAFALTHLYSPGYFVFAFFICINFNIFYIKINQKKNTFWAVGLTFLLHSCYNLYQMVVV